MSSMNDSKDIKIPDNLEDLDLSQSSSPKDKPASSVDNNKDKSKGIKPKKNSNNQGPKDKKKLGIVIAIAAVILLLLFFIIPHGNKSSNSKSNTAAQSSQVAKNKNDDNGNDDNNTNDSNNDGTQAPLKADDNNQGGLTKNATGGGPSSVRNELNGANQIQGQIQDLNQQWRNATVQYSQDNNQNNFENSLNDINNKRQQIAQSIKNNNKLYKSVLGKTLTETTNVMYSGLQKSYNADNSKDAVNIYNSTDNKINNNNSVFSKEFIKVLKDNNIKYTITNDGNTSKINY